MGAARRTPVRARTVFRRLDGIALLDKPGGMSSNQALQRVRHLVRAEKGGHTGALDPLATGLLPLCFGEATKIAGLLLGASKAYSTVARLGATTDTDDADGRVLLRREVSDLDRAAVEAHLPAFTGRIRQRPPAYSALKRDGEPLYAKARRGEQVEVDERDAEVFDLRIDAFDGERLTLSIECGSGTYVRSLVRDLGERLGCGAHVEQLRRLWVAPFMVPRMFTLDEVAERAAEGDAALAECLLPIEAGLAGMPRVVLDAQQAARMRHGQQLELNADPGLVLAVDTSGAAIALLDMNAGGLPKIRRVFSARE
jgi:tRNA pseudouridine55 synthase